LTGGVDQSLRCWENVAGASSKISPKRTLSNHTRPVIDLAMQPALDREIPLVASIAEDFTVRLWHPTIGRMIRFAKLESMPTAVCWIGGGKFLAVACGDGKVRVVNPETVEITQIREALSGPAYCIEADPAGNVLVGGIDGQLRVLTDLLSTLPATATADAAGR
jgi:WD40 repeat protein